MTLVLFIKLNYYLKCLDKLGFLLHMIESVYSDIRIFIFFFIFYNTYTGFYFSICITDLPSEYDGFGPLSYFLMSFRTSIGDPDFLTFANGSDY